MSKEIFITPSLLDDNLVAFAVLVQRYFPSAVEDVCLLSFYVQCVDRDRESDVSQILSLGNFLSSVLIHFPSFHKEIFFLSETL